MTELTATHQKILACMEDGVSEETIKRRFGYKHTDYLDACAHINRWKMEQSAGISFEPEASLESRVYRVLVDNKGSMMCCEIGPHVGASAREVARVCVGLERRGLLSHAKAGASHLWSAI